MKKRIVSLALVVAMIAIMLTSFTLAYFTDNEKATNTFTVGKVDIQLNETYTQDSKLVPAVFIPQDDSAEALAKGWGTWKNKVTKEVTVTNKAGSEDAYVRVFIAVPAVHKMDTFKAEFGALGENMVGFTLDEFSTIEGEWNWTTTTDGKYSESWNWYTANIGEIPYNIYVATYESVLSAGKTTATDAINGIKMSSNATNEMITWLDKNVSGWKNVYVVAEAAQADGFDNAFDALNTAFGDPLDAESPYRATFSPATTDVVITPVS